MAREHPDNGDQFSTLRTEVHWAADALLSRGIRPSLTLIEAEVSGPKKMLDHWLRDWAANLAPDSNYYPDPLLLVDRTRDPLIGAGNTIATRADAAAQREKARQFADVEELTREVERARAKVEKLAAAESSTVDKARSRLAALERRLADLETAGEREA